MNIKSSFIILMLLVLAACQKEAPQPAVSGSISGTVTSYDPATPLVTNPIEGIKLWLVDYDYPFDTLTYLGNEQAIVDSTFTDARGNYSFSNLSFGNYVVAPVPDTANYRFEATDPELTLPLSITETNPDKQVSFSAPWPGGENSNFTIHLKVIGNANPSYFTWGRQHFFLCIPYFTYVMGSDGPHRFYVVYTSTEHQDFEFGWTEIYYTLTNNFLFDFYEFYSSDYLESYWITQDLGNTPAESWWTIDLNAHTITRDSISNSANNTNKINNLTLRE